LQTPDTQVMPVAPGATLSRAPQSWPQVPQFLGSFCKLTHDEPQTSLAAPVHVVPHARPEAPIPHSGAEVGHLVPQAPQFCESARLVSQMSVARVVQWPKPVAHAELGTLQRPAWQVMPVAAGLTLRSVVQSFPQLPQFLGSLGEPQTASFPPS
jgi:hypothetical protein